MSNLLRTPRRAILLGLMLSLGFVAFSLTRPVSKAQEPAKALDRKALRDQVVTLRAEIELLEIDHSIDRVALSDSIKEERTILAKFKPRAELVRSGIDWDFFENCEVWAEAWRVLAAEEQLPDDELRKAGPERSKEEQEECLKTFGKEITEGFDAFAKITDKKEFSQARRQLADRVLKEIQTRATAEIRPKIAAKKKEFANQAAELAGKRLDLETLERQYREAR